MGREEERENEKDVHDEIVGGKGGGSEINIDLCKCISLKVALVLL